MEILRMTVQPMNTTVRPLATMVTLTLKYQDKGYAVIPKGRTFVLKSCRRTQGWYRPAQAVQTKGEAKE